MVNCSAQDLIDSFNTSNNGFKAESIFVIPTKNYNRYLIKITLMTKQEADHAIIDGLWLKENFIDSHICENRK